MKNSNQLCPLRRATRAGQKAIATQMMKPTSPTPNQPAPDIANNMIGPPRIQTRGGSPPVMGILGRRQVEVIVHIGGLWRRRPAYPAPQPGRRLAGAAHRLGSPEPGAWRSETG